MQRPRRRWTMGVALLALAVASLVFYYRQNVAAQIGGPMSIPKLLWLDYALCAWFLVPFFLWRSPLVAPELRRIYGWHLAGFALRGLAELWMLYVHVSWKPPYGMAHDLLDVALVTALLRGCRPASGRGAADAAAHGFLTSIRLGLLCEVVFAGLFYRATGGQVGIYFASSDPAFTFINRLTAAVLAFVYPDLVRTLWRARGALFPPAPHAPAAEVSPVQG